MVELPFVPNKSKGKYIANLLFKNKYLLARSHSNNSYLGIQLSNSKNEKNIFTETLRSKWINSLENI